MKILMITAALSLVLTFSAGAAEHQGVLGKASLCDRNPVSRVALTAPCCAQQLACSQFLSTTSMVHPNATPRT